MRNLKSLSARLFAVVIVISVITGCAANKPPHEKGDFRETDLVELIKLDSSIKLDIRYATKNNLAGKPVYSEARAFMQKPAAQALVKANEQLRQLGYGLLIFDGYRPGM